MFIFSVLLLKVNRLWKEREIPALLVLAIGTEKLTSKNFANVGKVSTVNLAPIITRLTKVMKAMMLQSCIQEGAVLTFPRVNWGRGQTSGSECEKGYCMGKVVTNKALLYLGFPFKLIVLFVNHFEIANEFLEANIKPGTSRLTVKDWGWQNI